MTELGLRKTTGPAVRSILALDRITSVQGDGLKLRSETRALMGYATTRPTNARLNLIDTFFASIAAVLPKLDGLYGMAGADDQVSRLSWVNPSSNILTANNAAFTTDRGFTGSSTASLSPGMSWAALSQYSLNSAHIGVWELSNLADNTVAVGGGASSNARIVPRSAGGILTGRINDATDIAGTTVASSNGHSVLNRSGASAREAYRDGVLVGSDTVAATAIPSTSISLLRNNGVSSTRQISFAHFGASLTAGEVATLWAAILAWLTGVGAL